MEKTKEVQKENIKEIKIKKSALELFYQAQQILKVKKSKYNKFSNFYYRSVEDIYDAWKALKLPLILTITDHVINVENRIFVEAEAAVFDLQNNLIKSAKAYAELGAGKAGMSTEQATGSASSYARKYALNGLFLLDDTTDPDSNQASKTRERGNVEETNLLIKGLQNIIKEKPTCLDKVKEKLGSRNLLKLTTKELKELIDIAENAQ